jgi:hypothetical protein
VAGETAAIGVYLQHPLLKLPFYIQAISNSAKSALEAEGEAMFLAALVVRALSLKNVCFFSNCPFLVEAAEAKPCAQTRALILMAFCQEPEFSVQRVVKIYRKENKIAHAQAKCAFRNRSNSSHLSYAKDTCSRFLFV